MRGKGTIFCLSSLVSILIFTGCASMQDLHQQFIESVRRPGEIMEKTPEETLQYYPSCSEQNIPALFETEIVPLRVLPGKEINHRIRYATCLTASSAPQNGEIVRTVYYERQAIFRDRTKYEFKPGTWTVDAFIRVSENARPGNYLVDTAIIYMGKTIGKIDTFQVKITPEGK
jgi:hypothetical protein